MAWEEAQSAAKGVFCPKKLCAGPTVFVTSFAAARCFVWSFGRIRRRGWGSSRWCVHAMPSFHVCRQVRRVTGVLDSRAALFADDVRLVKFPISLKKSKIMPNVGLVCVFWCIEYLLAANIVLVPLHVQGPRGFRPWRRTQWCVQGTSETPQDLNVTRPKSPPFLSARKYKCRHT